MGMIRVSTADLKARLGRFLRMVRAGETIEVTSHHHAVARIVAVPSQLDALVVAPARPVRDLELLRGVETRRKVDGVAALLADRSER
jgi:prevent-host-death family protein